MFADSALNPLNMLQSIIGVFPVAMSTIIVSPIALPSPIITAENIPGLAVGSITLIAVCQRLAPRARDPACKCLGTLERASSEIVNIMGITANPIAKPTIREFL